MSDAGSMSETDEVSIVAEGGPESGQLEAKPGGSLRQILETPVDTSLVDRFAKQDTPSKNNSDK